ncbi:MAG: hypothetical protein C0623_10645 [Desulfuromonas sp.]|nr:MAG: hypothetical protein C0623_10645 [Desulfuromonas sp.]
MRLIVQLVLICILLSFTNSFGQDLANPAAATDQTREAATEIDILPPGAKLIGEEEDNNVRATAYIYKNRPSAAAIDNMNQFPYLLFVQFFHSGNNTSVENGLVAFKIEDIAEQTKTPAVQMEYKNGYFVAAFDTDRLRGKRLLIGSKLEDEKKRQYSYDLRPL